MCVAVKGPDLAFRVDDLNTSHQCRREGCAERERYREVRAASDTGVLGPGAGAELGKVGEEVLQILQPVSIRPSVTFKWRAKAENEVRVGARSERRDARLDIDEEEVARCLDFALDGVDPAPSLRTSEVRPFTSRTDGLLIHVAQLVGAPAEQAIGRVVVELARLALDGRRDREREPVRPCQLEKLRQLGVSNHIGIADFLGYEQDCARDTRGQRFIEASAGIAWRQIILIAPDGHSRGA